MAQFYFTSEANSYGLINNEWMEGNVMAVALDGNKNSKKICKILTIRPNRPHFDQ